MIKFWGLAILQALWKKSMCKKFCLLIVYIEYQYTDCVCI